MRWHQRELEGLPRLVDIATERPPDDFSPSWLPLRSLSASLPGLFTAPSTEYAKVKAKDHPLPVTLRAICSVRASYPSVFPDVLHFAAAAGFSNFAAMQRGATPQGFVVSKYQ